MFGSVHVSRVIVSANEKNAGGGVRYGQNGRGNRHRHRLLRHPMAQAVLSDASGRIPRTPDDAPRRPTAR